MECTADILFEIYQLHQDRYLMHFFYIHIYIYINIYVSLSQDIGCPRTLKKTHITLLSCFYFFLKD